MWGILAFKTFSQTDLGWDPGSATYYCLLQGKVITPIPLSNMPAFYGECKWEKNWLQKHLSQTGIVVHIQ